MKIARALFRNVIQANFLFMSAVALLFGLFALWGIGASPIALYSIHAFALRGNFFLWIIFSVELSKDLLQKDKITKKVEWQLSNGMRLFDICLHHTLALFLASVLLLLPLMVLTWKISGDFDPLALMDFYLQGFVYSIIINVSILVMQNMGRAKHLGVFLSILYAGMFAAEVSVTLFTGVLVFGMACRYALTLLGLSLLTTRLSRERVVSAFF